MAARRSLVLRHAAGAFGRGYIALQAAGVPVLAPRPPPPLPPLRPAGASPLRRGGVCESSSKRSVGVACTTDGLRLQLAVSPSPWTSPGRLSRHRQESRQIVASRPPAHPHSAMDTRAPSRLFPRRAAAFGPTPDSASAVALAVVNGAGMGAARGRAEAGDRNISAVKRVSLGGSEGFTPCLCRSPPEEIYKHLRPRP